MDETQTTGTDVPAQAATTDAQDSSANVVDTSTPEATQDEAQAQEAQAPETNAEETVDEKLYAGKYKSAEDLERAYLSAQSEASRMSQEKAELIRVLNESVMGPNEVATQGNDDDYDSYEEQPQVNREMDQLRLDNAVTKFILLHGDADAESMQEVLNTDPLVGRITGFDARLEYAYQKSQNMTHAKALAEAQRVGAQQAQAKAAEKQVAQVEEAKKSAPVNDKAEKLARARYGDKAARAELISSIPAVQEMKRMAGIE